MEGHLTLIDIKIPTSGVLPVTDKFGAATTQLYAGVTGTFCHISWDLQDDNPSAVPSFHDLQQASFLCPGTLYTADLWDISRQAERYDAAVLRGNGTAVLASAASADTNKGGGGGGGAAHTAVPPTAVIFHESRCGSTVIANALAAFLPHHTRVYAEAAPPAAAIQACEAHSSSASKSASSRRRPCDQRSHHQLIRDVFFLMGRVTRPSLPQYAFYKMQSVSVQSIDAFAQAMPATPWIFAYCDSVEVMMSHFSHYQQGLDTAPSSDTPECLRNYGKSEELQPPLVTELVTAAGRLLESLSKEEYCAAHLAALAEAAVREHERTLQFKVAAHGVTVLAATRDGGSAAAVTHAAPPHWFVNYSELPHKIWETLLPALVVHGVSRAEIDRMHAAVKVYSKAARDKKTDKGAPHWQEDSTLKQGRAPASIKEAAKLFMDPVYAQLEAIRTGVDQEQ